MERNRDMEEACVRYFKERKVFEKLFRGFREKYESLGHVGGTVLLTGLSGEEREQLGGFLGRDCFGKKQISVSSRAFERALERSRFSAFTIKEILEAYDGKALSVKKEERLRKERAKEAYFERLSSLAENEAEAGWLRECIGQKNSVYRYMEKCYHKEPDDLYAALRTVCRAGSRLPAMRGEYELLPVFATNIASDPHAFDAGTMLQYLLLSYLRFYFASEQESDGSETSRAEQVWELFYKAGIVKDDLSNAVLMYGLHGSLPDGSRHAGLEGFCLQHEPVQLTMLSLSGLQSVFAEKKRIFMVENPSVFSYLCKKYPQESFICGNGQQRLSIWILLKKIKEHSIFYAGDFDPEGLGIAQRLKQRFPDRIRLWNYTCSLYLSHLSGRRISTQSLKKLDGIVLPELRELCRQMREIGYAAYQEAMLEEYVIEKC